MTFLEDHALQWEIDMVRKTQLQHDAEAFNLRREKDAKIAQLEAELQAAGNRVRELEFERDMLLGKSDAVHLGAQAAVTALHQCQAIVAERDELKKELAELRKSFTESIEARTK